MVVEETVVAEGETEETVVTEVVAEDAAGLELARTRRRSGCHAQSLDVLCSRSAMSRSFQICHVVP